MKNNYDYCLREVLKSEGGYTNDPNDKGGPTNFGITIADYKKYINANGTAEDVKNMTVEQAKNIYKTRYWDSIDGDNLPSGVDYCVFDYGVNSGPSRALKVKNQFKDVTDPVDLINKICDERLRFMHNIRGGKDWAVFGKGWQRRVDGVRANSIKLTKGTSSSTVAAGTVVAAGAGAAATAPHNYLPWIIGGTFLIAFIAFLVFDIYSYRQWKRENATA